ncbi:SufE family protein [Aliidiomarina sp. Khilg15.8]
MIAYPDTALQLQQQLNAQPNWQERYRQLLKAAKSAPRLADTECVPETRVSGCEARVWLKVSGSREQVTYRFYSDARMVHALIHVALAPLQGQSAAAAAEFDTAAWLSACGLQNELSPSRSNGLYQVIKQAKQSALALAVND